MPKTEAISPSRAERLATLSLEPGDLKLLNMRPSCAADIVAPHILEAEGVAHEPGCLERVYEQTGGDMRQYVNVLQALQMRADAPCITDAMLRKLLPAPGR